MFGDSSFVLMTDAERDGKHSLDIENENIAKIELDLYLGRVRTFDEKGNLMKEIFLDIDNFARFLSTDRLAHKYPDLNPYNFVGNNPIRNIDPNGDSIVVVNAKQGMSAKNKTRFESLVNNSFNNKMQAQLTTTGALKLSFAEGQSLETLTQEEVTFYNVLDQASNGKNINGEDVDVEIKVVFSPQGHEKSLVMIGQYATGKIDLDDIENNFGINSEDNTELTQRALLGHEIYEQYMKQSGMALRYRGAHSVALFEESKMSGMEREDGGSRDWVVAGKSKGLIYTQKLDGKTFNIYTDKYENIQKVEYGN